MPTLPHRILFITTVMFLSGCKLALISGEGGAISSESGDIYCGTARYCVVEITEVDFEDTYTAVPAEGYEFVRWQGGTGFLCGDSTNLSCTVSIDGNPLANFIVGSFGLNHIMPVYKDVGIDTDNDGLANRIDPDDDNDGIPDEDDPCPLALLCGTADVIEQLSFAECSTGGDYLYQSFTATETGSVGELQFAIDAGLGSLWLTVHEGSDETGPIIYSDYSVRLGNATNLGTLTHGTINVVQGQTYTFEFWAGVGSWTFCGSSSNPYTDGAAFDGTLPAGWDLGFSIEIVY